MVLPFRKLIALLVLAGFPCCWCIAQEMAFDHLTTDDGLLTGNVRTILKDYQGFFWFGTEDGLQRYDGYTMVNYLHDANDSTSLSSNYILDLFEDSQKNLWVGTLDAGLCLYDRNTDSFKRYVHNPANKNSILGNYVRVIYESKDSTIYIGLEEGGFSYFKVPQDVPSSIAFTNVAIPTLKSTGANMVNAIIENPDHTILIGVNGSGLNQFDPATGMVKGLLQDSCSNRVHNLLLDSKNRLWIGSWDNGLYIYDRSSKKMTHHAVGNSPGTLPQNQIETIFEDREGNFWIGTDNGLCLVKRNVDPSSEKPFITYTHNEFEPSSLLSNSIKAFFMDDQHRMWIGSYYGGINIYSGSIRKFFPVRSKSWSDRSLSNSNVFAFTEDNDGQLWIGTDGGGMNLMREPLTNIADADFIKVPILLDGKPVVKVKCVEPDQLGNLWIGTWGSGMFRLNSKTYTYEHFGMHPTPGKGTAANEVLTIKADSLNNLWIGTFNGGLNFFDHSSKTFTYYTNFLSNGKTGQINRVTAIHIGRKGQVWVGREVGGLSLFNPQTRTFRIIENGVLGRYLTILCIHEDEQGVLWLGTNSIGLIRYDPARDSVKLFDGSSGLPNNVVYSILESPADKNLWLSTNMGLSMLSISSGTFSNYTKADGLQGNQFNPGSALLHSSGLMLFGGVSGMNVFDPRTIKKNSDVPPVVFTGFWLEDKEANIGDTGSPLSKNIIQDQTIHLRHNQNSFSIEFAILEYDPGMRNRYRYFLEEFNTSWQDIGRDRKATFTNLNPGTYRLKVMASNSDGQWTDTEKSIQIVIHPAWWQTVLFKVVLALSVGLIVLGLFRLRILYLLKQKALLESQVTERTVELKNKNEDLADKLEEIRSQNEVLHAQKIEIAEMNQEIQAQNEELTSQNDQIMLQREKLEEAHHKLENTNEQLEVLVLQRTRKLEETIAELDKTVAELDRFVYSASHDLSAPLKSVLGLVGIARFEKDPEALEKYYEYIETSIRKLDRVIKSLVEFSRNSQQELTITRFNIFELTQEVLHELAFWPDAQKVTFVNKIGIAQEMASDQERVKVVLHNLIGNGIKYADPSKEKSFIEIETEESDSRLVLKVSDNGIGIKKESQPRIFDMYYRGTDRSKGSGLGLFIVKEILLKLDGTIEVDSTKGEGSVFTLTFRNGIDHA